jgi:hypothetical protein
VAMIRRKSFVGPIFYPLGTPSLNAGRDRVRDQAEAFINEVAGVDNVVTVAEHAMTFGPFSVVVWYRDESPPSKPRLSIDEMFD